MRKLFLIAAALGGSLVVTAPASAQLASPGDAASYHPSNVVLVASDPPTAVTKVVRVQAPLPRVTVVAGDTLSGIGARTHRTWEQLASFNHIPNPNLIYVAQVVVIPPASFLAGPVALPAPAPTYTPPVQTHYSAPTRTYTASRPSVGSSSGGGGGGGAYTGIWACIAYHESGGNPSENTGNGYYGGLQFTQQTWNAYGGSGNAANASASEQEAVANRIVAAQGGYGAWPNTSRMCGV